MLWQAERERKAAAEVAPTPLCAPALEYPEYPQITPEAPREYPESTQSTARVPLSRCTAGRLLAPARSVPMQGGCNAAEYPQSTHGVPL